MAERSFYEPEVRVRGCRNEWSTGNKLYIVISLRFECLTNSGRRRRRRNARSTELPATSWLSFGPGYWIGRPQSRASLGRVVGVSEDEGACWQPRLASLSKRLDSPKVRAMQLGQLCGLGGGPHDP